MIDLIYSEALQTVLDHTFTGNIITIDVIPDSLKGGYTLAEDIKADRDFPHFNRSAMDGFAIRSLDYSNDILFKVIGTLTAGHPDNHVNPYINSDSDNGPFALRIMTGAPVPLWADVVIRFEDSKYDDYNKTVTFYRDSVDSFINIARRGEDAAAGSVILPSGSPVNNSTLPVIAASGYHQIKVRKKPTILLVTTGTEVVSINKNPLDHQIRDRSSQAIKYLAAAKGIEADSVKVPDDATLISAAFQKGLNEYDILLITGGVSKGITDQVPDLLKAHGVREIFHRAKIKPGKPVFFGINDKLNSLIETKRVLVFGLPGNPVFSQVNLKIFVEESIAKITGQKQQIPLRLPLSRKKIKKLELTEFTQCRFTMHNRQTALEPITHNDSLDFVNLAKTDGLMIHPAERPDLLEGTVVAFYPW